MGKSHKSLVKSVKGADQPYKSESKDSEYLNMIAR